MERRGMTARGGITNDFQPRPSRARHGECGTSEATGQAPRQWPSVPKTEDDWRKLFDDQSQNPEKLAAETAK